MAEGRVTGNSSNIYTPFRAKIKSVVNAGCDVKLFEVIPGQKTVYSAGQFFMVSLWGDGEVPISVTSFPGLKKNIEFAIRKAGAVTGELHKLRRGDSIWLRGPYGNGFSIDKARHKDIIFIAGGIGIAPLRSLINFILVHRKEYKRIFLLYGSKKPSEILFERDIRKWGQKGMETIFTVDSGDSNWSGNVGLVTEYIGRIDSDFKKAYSFVCGPEVMIANVLKELSAKGMPDSHIITTLESRMKCGMGKCGQCYKGGSYVCTHGPVFSYAEMKKFGITFF